MTGKISRMFTAEGLNTSQIHPKNSMPPKYFRASQGRVINPLISRIFGQYVVKGLGRVYLCESCLHVRLTNENRRREEAFFLAVWLLLSSFLFLQKKKKNP